MKIKKTNTKKVIQKESKKLLVKKTLKNKILNKNISTKIKSASKNKTNNIKLKTKSKSTNIKLKTSKNSISSIIENQKQITKPDLKVLITINSFILSLNKALKQNKVNADATIGGSVAKGTFIKDNFDADIFVKFDIKYRGENISDILEKVLKNMKLEYNKVHGSRDYFQIKKEFTYELVPVLMVKDYREAENVADMSPLHVHYFVKQSKKIKNLRDEIRITKVFMKSARVYGAESYIKGFSGHTVDLLIIKYKTFLDLIKNAAKWKDEVIIDIEKYHIDPKMSLNSSKISGPLIIVDPVQKNRNAAAAISKESFELFKEKSKEFLKNPSVEFFSTPDFSKIVNEKISTLKNVEIFLLNIKPLEGKRDVVGSKILKIKEHVEKIAKEEEFKLIWSDWYFNENNSRICFAFEKQNFGKTKITRGPPLDMIDAVKSFKQSHIKTFIKENYIYSEDTREYPNIKILIEKVIKYPYIVDKYKTCNLVEMNK